jgi:hypothetical protein
MTTSVEFFLLSKMTKGFTEGHEGHKEGAESSFLLVGQSGC